MSNITNLNTVAKAAKGASRITTPVFPSWLLVSAWAIESSWGQKKIGENNYFGMKFVPERHEMSVWSPTVEYLTADQLNKTLLTRQEQSDSIRYLNSRIVTDPLDKNYNKWKVDCECRFADYPSFQAGLEDVVKLLGCIYNPYKSIYKLAWRAYRDSGNWRQFAKDYGAIYATGGGYSDLLIKIAEQKNVKTALSAVGVAYK